MQTLESIEFHNAHPEPREGGIWQLPRYPAEVRDHLSDKGRMRSMDSCGVEIRFVTDAKNIRITLSCEDSDADIQVFCGPFLHHSQRILKGVPTAMHLIPSNNFKEASDAVLRSGGFAPNVWRVITGRQNGTPSACLFHYLETFGHSVRAPKPEELPSIRWLAYGSSITHSHLAGYPFHAARLLHWDLFAKGLSGACHIETAATDYLSDLAAKKKVDLITAELGVNMRNEYSIEAFTQRATYLVKKLRQANPQAQIVLITAFTNSHHHPREARDELKTQPGFDQALRNIVQHNKDARLHLIEGSKLLSDFTLLRADLLHPSESGHALMGQNLATHLSQLIQQ
jgi:lysophospholipase L1-like esterase